jgi:Helix-turn-helix domain
VSCYDIRQELAGSLGLISSAVREKVATLVASGRYSNAEIASRLGIGERTVYRLRKRPTFIAAVQQILDSYRKRYLKQGLARKELRIAELTAMYNALDELVEARKADTRFTWIPGFSSGLVQVTSLTRLAGPASAPVSEQLDGQSQISFLNLSGTRVAVRFAIDLATVAQKCAILDQIASESGDKLTRVEVRKISSLRDLTDEEVVAVARDAGQPVPKEFSGLIQ